MGLGIKWLLRPLEAYITQALMMRKIMMTHQNLALMHFWTLFLIQEGVFPLSWLVQISLLSSLKGLGKRLIFGKNCVGPNQVQICISQCISLKTVPNCMLYVPLLPSVWVPAQAKEGQMWRCKAMWQGCNGYFWLPWLAVHYCHRRKWYCASKIPAQGWPCSLLEYWCSPRCPGSHL